MLPASSSSRLRWPELTEAKKAILRGLNGGTLKVTTAEDKLPGGKISTLRRLYTYLCDWVQENHLPVRVKLRQKQNCVWVVPRREEDL